MKSQVILFLGIALLVGVAYGGYMFVQNNSVPEPVVIPGANNAQRTQTEQALRVMSDGDRTQIQVGQSQLDVEVIHTEARLTQGLSGRDSIGSDGLLFMMPQRAIQSFWMREMKFDIDIIWIDGTTVVGITKNVPHPDPSTPLSELPNYTSPSPADTVLEVAAGAADQYQITVGDEVRLLAVQ